MSVSLTTLMYSIRVAARTVSAVFSLSMRAAALPYNEFGSQAVGTPVSSSVAISLTPAQLQAGIILSFHYGTDSSVGVETMLAKQAPTGSPDTKRITSEAQIAANRENATHSTGPTSDIGKAIVSQNRIVHGLNYNPNTFRVLGCEDQSAYDDLRRQLTTDHKPTETTETLLVTRMAQHRWLLDRANRLQEICFDQQTAETTDQKLFSHLRYATTHEQAFHKCLTDLLKLRSTEQKTEFGFESEKRRADRHRAFVDLEELNFILKQQKMLMAQSDFKPSAHPDMWPAGGQKAA